MDSVIFIGLVIVAITQMVKMALPQVTGWVTIIIAFVVGVIVALIDGFIGVTDISIAQGVMTSLTAIGISTLAGKAGGGSPGDQGSVR